MAEKNDPGEGHSQTDASQTTTTNNEKDEKSSIFSRVTSWFRRSKMMKLFLSEGQAIPLDVDQVIFLPTPDSAIKSSLIASKILAHLDFADLVNLRMVNKSWSVAASNELIKRKSSRVLSFYAAFDSRMNNQELKKLNQVLKDRKFIFPPTALIVNKFPCTRFEFDGLLSSPHIKKLFTLHGQGIKVLEFNFPTHDKAKLRRLDPKLLQQTPNLEELYLDASDFPCDLDLRFPSLKIFNGGQYPCDGSDRSSLAYKILMGSDNLEQIQQVKVKNMVFFVLNGKGHLIKIVASSSDPISGSGQKNDEANDQALQPIVIHQETVKDNK